MTLVELMVAIGITAIIMGMSVLVFQRQYSSYRSGHAVKTAQTDVQKSLELIKDEFASAGWSVKPEMAFFFRDGGNNTADDLYLNNTSLIYVGDNDTQAERELILMVDSDCGGCMLYSGKNPINGLDIDGDGVDDLDEVPVLVLQDTQVYNDSTSGTGALATTPAGTVERWVTPAIHYCVDDGVNCHPASSEETNVLRRETDSGGRVTFAENVVDLQVVYMDDSNATYGESGCTGGACQMSPFEASRIRWVEVT
ncbi:MAG: prepilin-type N-terminal cleavage/methylation domain-containing protein, partial [Rubrivivax sp.]|nr:prepilin-type N-terminal cleavage/methylation domain-containing protein [Rubrivivax sp.]